MLSFRGLATNRGKEVIDIVMKFGLVANNYQMFTVSSALCSFKIKSCIFF